MICPASSPLQPIGDYRPMHRMHIAILLAGHTNKAMPQRFHAYNDMFTTLFQGLLYGKYVQYTALAAVDDIFPDRVDD